jgi:uncharacterized protein (TIGR03437 family)
VAVDPAGKFLYVSNAASGSVTAFSIGATGALQQLPRGTYPAIAGAFAAILDPAGKFLYVPGQQANALTAFTIDPATGALTPFARPFIPAGAQPERGATVLLSPPVIPPILLQSAVNYFSNAPPGMPSAGIAQGSRMALSGQNIGPAVEADADSTLTTELGGVTVQIQSGDVTTAALLVAAANDFVSVLVPSTTPLGDATVTITYKGRTTAPMPITIVPVAPGIRTLNGQGNGPAKAYNVPPEIVELTEAAIQIPNALNQAAKPGQLMIVQGTGLGATTADETQNALQEMDAMADVIVGNIVVSATGTVRVGGNDFILFPLPNTVPEGCYVPIVVRSGGVISNAGSISVSSTSSTCTEPTGLSASDINLAQKNGGLNMAGIGLSRIDFAGFGIQSEAQANFGRFDFQSLRSAFAPMTGVGIRQSFGTPPLGTCTVSPGVPLNPNHAFDLPGDPTFAQFLNPGPTLTITGPQGALALTAPNYDVSPDGDAFPPGSYSADNGAGTQQIGAFKAALTLPPPLTWTNPPAQEAPLDRTQDFTVTWSGGVPDKEYVLVVGLSASAQATAGFLCAEKVSAGKFTVPAWVLSSLPASQPVLLGGQSVSGGLAAVGTAPLPAASRFSGPGLDFGLFTYEQAVVDLVTYQ